MLRGEFCAGQPRCSQWSRLSGWYHPARHATTCCRSPAGFSRWSCGAAVLLRWRTFAELPSTRFMAAADPYLRCHCPSWRALLGKRSIGATLSLLNSMQWVSLALPEPGPSIASDMRPKYPLPCRGAHCPSAVEAPKSRTTEALLWFVPQV